MFMTTGWGQGISSGFRFFIFLTVALTILGYMSGNPYLVPNMVNSVVSQFKGHHADSETAMTIDSHPVQPEKPYKVVVSPPEATTPEVENRMPDPVTHTPVTVSESDRAHLPEGWQDWSPDKRARYVRALMSRIDT